MLAYQNVQTVMPLAVDLVNLLMMSVMQLVTEFAQQEQKPVEQVLCMPVPEDLVPNHQPELSILLPIVKQIVEPQQQTILVMLIVVM